MSRPRRSTVKRFSPESESEDESPKTKKVKTPKLGKKNKVVEDSSSESDIESYLQPIDQIDLRSEFFNIPSKPNVLNETLPTVSKLSDSDSDLESSKNESQSEYFNNAKTADDSEEYEAPKTGLTQTMVNLKQLEDYSRKISEAKESVAQYQLKKQNEVNNIDISNLLIAGEKAVQTLDDIRPEDLHSSDFESCESENEDWEEVKHKQEEQKDEIIPNKSIEITVDMPDVVKKKKGTDLLMAMKRRLNRIRKENQVYVHQVHVLCWLAHGFYLNRSVNHPQTLALALSLLPSDQCYPNDRTDLAYLEQILKWYKRTVKIVEKDPPNDIPLSSSLQMQINKKEVCDKKMLVLLFVAILRSLGIQARIVLSFQVEPLRPPASDLHSLSTKEKESKSSSKRKSDSKSEIDLKKKKESSGENSAKKSTSKSGGETNKGEKSKKGVQKGKSSEEESIKSAKSRSRSLKAEEKELKVPSRKSKSVSPHRIEENIETDRPSEDQIKKPAPRTRSRASKAQEKPKDNELKVSSRKTRSVSPSKTEESEEKQKISKSSEDTNNKPSSKAKSQTSKAQEKSNRTTSSSEIEESKEKQTRESLEEQSKISDTKTRSRTSRAQEKPKVEELSSKKSRSIPPSKIEESKEPLIESSESQTELKQNFNEESEPNKSNTTLQSPKVNPINPNQLNIQKKPRTRSKSPSITITASEDPELVEEIKLAQKSSQRQTRPKPKPQETLNVVVARRSKSLEAKPDSSKESKPRSKSKEAKPKTNEILIKLKFPVKNKKTVPQVDGIFDSSDSEIETDSIPQVDGSNDEPKPNLKKLKDTEEACKDKIHPKRLRARPSYAETNSEDEFETSPKQKIKPNLSRLGSTSSSGSKSSPGDVRNDIVSLVKGRIKEQMYIDQNKLVKSKQKRKIEDVNYAPEPIKKKHHESDDEFVPKVKVKQRVQPKSKLLAEEKPKDKSNRKGVDVWCEVFLEMEEKWISVDVVQGQVHCVNEIYARATHPVAYVVGWNNNDTIKDVTSRYCQNFNTVVRKLRADADWWRDCLRPFKGKRTARDKEEDRDLKQQQLEKPLPTSIAEYKNHPLYALSRHLLKFEAIYPPDQVPLGYVKGEPVYPRKSVYTCRSRDIWLKDARVVKLGEQPYKIVKARPKYDKLSNSMVSGQMLEIFGYWQTEEYDPPTAEDGIVPRNCFGNVELFKPCMLPKKTVWLQLPGLNKVAKKLGIDCAPAITGFDFHSGWTHPVYDGFVVCEEFSEILQEAWKEDQEEMFRKENEKIEKRVYDNWKRLIKGLLIRERLNAKYDFGESSGTSQEKKKVKPPTFPTKKKK